MYHYKKRAKKPKETDISEFILGKVEAVTPKPSEISVDKLIDDSLLALYREVKNILAMTVSGKLEPEYAKDLRDHLKLLFELKKREDDALKSLTEDQLRLKLKEILDADNNDRPVEGSADAEESREGDQ